MPARLTLTRWGALVERKFRLCLPRSLEAHPAPPNRLLVVMGAAAAGGLRWALTQLLLTSIGEGVNSHGADIETKARVALLEADEGALRNDGAARGAATHRLSRSLRRDLGDTSVPPPFPPQVASRHSCLSTESRRPPLQRLCRRRSSLNCLGCARRALRLIRR